MARSRLLIISGNKRIRTIAVVVVARKKLIPLQKIYGLLVSIKIHLLLCVFNRFAVVPNSRKNKRIYEKKRTSAAMLTHRHTVQP